MWVRNTASKRVPLKRRCGSPGNKKRDPFHPRTQHRMASINAEGHPDRYRHATMISPSAPLTDAQRNSVTQFRTALISSFVTPPSTAESLDERGRRPDPEHIPADVTVHIEIAPPSTQPHPLLDNSLLKTPERVPIYFFALRPESESDVPRATTRVIFFIHGGGNIVGHPTNPPFLQFYMQLLRAIAASGDSATRCVLVAPCYRLATVPENVFPAALQDLVAAYDHVLGMGYDASNIVIAGDSAGGNHAIVLTHLVLQSSRPSPRSVIAIAPSAILSYDDLSAYARAQADKDIFDVPTLKLMRNMYVGDSGVSRMDPLVSGALVPFAASWPRTLILVGTADHLIDGSRELEKRLKAVGRPVELVEYDERPHGWWVMPNIFPENIQDAVQRMAQFVLH
ncbi:Alpha/Beta hydrolase protein [Boletus edulis BED1]|uniref:Alpha/Beta hydrolase protein n=1 Tax=Boletus edulis BED1 TaxID=1328754 RepID=A0AAD4GLC2_BOLED|nr:Alpha/Beta hydrolase protein [Boletus edulis BED1]